MKKLSLCRLILVFMLAISPCLNVAWADDDIFFVVAGKKAQPMTLPFSGATYSPNNSVFSITNTGGGTAGFFSINIDPNNPPPNTGAAALVAETNGSGPAIHGLVGSATGFPAHFKINNPSNSSPAVLAETNGSGPAINALSSGSGLGVHSYTSGSGHAIQGHSVGTGLAGSFIGNVTIDGHLIVNGSADIAQSLGVGGTKNFIQPHPTDPTKELSYAAMEGPENAIFLRGTVKLVEGKAVIETPEYFRLVAGDDGITVQFTPRALESKGLAAIEVTRERIVIGELMNGKGNYEFDYFITAKRHGFEKHEPIQPNKHFRADNVTKEKFEEQYARMDEMSNVAIRNLLISNGILSKEGKLNMVTVRRLGWKVKEAEVAQAQK